MGSLLLVLGLGFIIAGFLSIAEVTDVGMQYARYIQLHTLPILQDYPDTWVYIGFGVLLILLSFALVRRS